MKEKSPSQKFLLTIVLILISVSFFSCSDSTGPQTPDKTVTGIYGILHNYNPDENILKARLFLDSGVMILGTDTVQSDSVLNMPLSTPPDSVLRPMQEVANGFGCCLTVSDQNARGTSFISLDFYYDNGNISGYLQKLKAFGNPTYWVGGYQVRFAYCDRPTNVTGQVVLIYSIIGPPDTIVYNVDIQLSKGWNPVTYTTVNIDTNYYEYKITCDDPAGSKWYYWDSQPGNFLHPFKPE